MQVYHILHNRFAARSLPTEDAPRSWDTSRCGARLMRINRWTQTAQLRALPSQDMNIAERKILGASAMEGWGNLSGRVN